MLQETVARRLFCGLERERDLTSLQGASLTQTAEARWHQGCEAGGLNASFKRSWSSWWSYLQMVLFPESAFHIRIERQAGCGPWPFLHLENS